MGSGKDDNKRKYMMMIFGAFAIFFTGYPHIWSVYQPYAMELTGWTQEQSSLCFYLAMAFFVFGNITGGRLQDKYSPRLAISIGGGIFSAGILLSAAAMRPSPLMIYLSYGVMQGFGQGMIYTTIISTAQKWFPGRAGFSSGIIVTANGLCGFFLAPLSKILLARFGISITFIIIGCFIAISWILAWIFVKNPGGSKQGVEVKNDDKKYQYTSSEMVRTGRFYLLMFTMMFGLISYLIISPLSQSIQIERGVAQETAVIAIMFGSICNALARLILPAVADKKGRVLCVRWVLIVSFVSMSLLVFAPSYLSTAAIIVMYGCYGGIMGNFPSLSSTIFGLKYSGENYGFVMIGIVAATFLAPAITAIVKNSGYDMGAAFICGAACALSALVCLILLQKQIKNPGRQSWKKSI